MSVHHSSTGQSRRGFLRNAALAGAGAAALGATAAAPAFAAGSDQSSANRWNPDQASPRFTFAVMPDTQFLYWAGQNSVNREPQEESFRYIIGNSDNIVFMSHLGDLTEDADPASFREVGKAFELLDSHGVAYSVLAGNHDVTGDDSRGSTAYLQTMGPQRFKHSKTFAGSDPSGYNTAHIFQAAGMSWMVLALDWRTTDQGFAWANDFIKAHPKMPVILTTHEIVAPTYGDTVFPYQYGDPENNAALSAYGQTLWTKLINDNDQIFLTLNGHYWPAGRTTKQNAAGNDVHLHITNYQNRYYGGGAMLRLYHFDLTRNTIDVETIAPWFLAQNRNALAAQEARLTTATDYFPCRSTSSSASRVSSRCCRGRLGRPASWWCRAPWRTGGSTAVARPALRSRRARRSGTCPGTATTSPCNRLAPRSRAASVARSVR
jgi:hypothetical protein